MMDIEGKKENLRELYEQYEEDVAEFKKAAACELRCADCCIGVGDVDITTLEGVIIRERMDTFDKALQAEIKARLAQNKEEREEGKLSRCAFLKGDKTCMIYDIRPFSCRQLYSVKRCNSAPPTIHRQAVNLAKQTVDKMQRLDFGGYSGHISYILYLLDKEDFRRRYLHGKSDPRKIVDFGRSHGIVINRFVSG
ncbi:MAG: YkgJ family cysteine cluster protein [Deltaproteobacteria bacterium]|nr:YkgJ family cysteine cluster protein [Deltaproteobacteria bacterium]